MFGSISVESRLAHLALESGSVVQTTQTFARLTITIARLRDVYVFAALTFGALLANQIRVTEVVLITTITSLSGVARQAVAKHILGAWVELARVRM